MDSNGVVLVTGTSSGFGRVTVETLSRKGYTVFASMRNVAGRNAAASAELRALAEKEGISLRVVELDVTDDSSVEAAVTEVISQAGRIDVLVNNAGVLNAGLFETFTLEQVQQIFDVNFLGVVRMNRAVLPHMRRQGTGLLVYMSSTYGRIVPLFSGIYTATKFALEALAETYHYELFEMGIDSTILDIGGFPTAMFNNIIQPADVARGADYGPIAETQRKLQSLWPEVLSRPDAPDPQMVADTVAELISTPIGNRPLRTLVGQTAQLAAELNRVAAQAQRNYFANIGKMIDMPNMADLFSPGDAAR